MAKYVDFQLEKDEYDSSRQHDDSDALILAIRNILLSRPGNFPFNPSIGVNIRKYQFELIDNTQIASIQKEIDRAIGECIPDINSVSTIVRRIDDEDGKPYLAISINSSLNGNEKTANFLLRQDGNDVKIFNEIF